MSYKKACRNCKDLFETNHLGKVFCSRQCAKEWQKEAYRFSHYPGLPNATTGAIGELRVCVDLLIKGYEVFRSVSPSCSCDLAILKDGKLYRIEVRTAYANAMTGKRMAPIIKENGKYEIYAAVYKDEIMYLPSLP